ncbi:hypothetical protein QMK19_36135 [Streptomyces sp. H10-C2]|uniref:hypothetical protein n=1 Tax=unclassified Streptomyces TaxID=2593676 RepID=UPI0024B94B7D|nr:MULTISPECIES: hypothetical protein [unclassified Streptomyces]MDJ0346293.1 hypothetical protein [Streptomyces sp. PH10-H1]MDJ0374902.1 hypothetical protein [Streptomyces sp. H10-C2]
MSTRESNPALECARLAMQPLLDEFMSRSQTQAIYVLSSSASSPGNLTVFDEESDFDVSLVLDIPMDQSQWRSHPEDTYRILADRIPTWVPPFLFYVPVPWGRMEVNIHQLILPYEDDPRTIWRGEKCDVYLNKSEQLMDRGGAFGRLIRRKVERGHFALVREQQRLANRVTWDVREMPLRQGRRLGPEAGHHVLNAALEEVIDCIYVTANQFVPNRKWKLDLLLGLSLITGEQAALLKEVMRCDLTFADLQRRIHALERFCESAGIAVAGPQAEAVRAIYQEKLQVRGKQCAAPSADVA